MTIGRITKQYSDQESENARSGIFVNQGYWKDPRFLINSTLSTTAILISKSEFGIKGTIIERTYDLDKLNEGENIEHQCVKDWLGEENLKHLANNTFSTSRIEF